MMFTTETAAEYLGLKETTLEAWRCRGGGPDFIKMKKAVRYRKEDLDRYIDARVRRSTSEASK